jgi:hypothetical protein
LLIPTPFKALPAQGLFALSLRFCVLWLIDSSLSNVLLSSDSIGGKIQYYDRIFEALTGY